jgi:hypothetical protein
MMLFVIKSDCIPLIGVEKKLFSSLEGFCDLNSKFKEKIPKILYFIELVARIPALPLIIVIGNQDDVFTTLSIP